MIRYLPIIKFITPVTKAVINIIINKFMLPYFSSIIGPSNKIFKKFELKCPKSRCPNMFVKNLSHVNGFIKDALSLENK